MAQAVDHVARGCWPMAPAPWPVAHGPWFMDHGPWLVAHWPMAHCFGNGLNFGGTFLSRRQPMA